MGRVLKMVYIVGSGNWLVLDSVAFCICIEKGMTKYEALFY